MRYKNSAIPQL